jgi:hypothetical protein
MSSGKLASEVGHDIRMTAQLLHRLIVLRGGARRINHSTLLGGGDCSGERSDAP